MLRLGTVLLTICLEHLHFNEALNFVEKEEEEEEDYVHDLAHMT